MFALNMLLSIDIGNSNIFIGLFDKDKLIYQTRLITLKNKDYLHYKKQLTSLIKSDVTNIVIGSVVNELDDTFKKLATVVFKADPLFVSTRLETNAINLSKKETGLGADRLANTIAAIEKYNGNRIVIDLGTASKFEVISKKNEYIGGAIAPGVGVSFDGLISRASKLSESKIYPPKKVVGGWSTQEHLDSGFVYGFSSLIDGMIEKIAKDQKWDNYQVIITGGFSDLISPFVNHKHTKDNILTLDGLRIIWETNS